VTSGLPLGLIEGFFGPPWPERDRLDFAPFLQRLGFSFYLYAPKADPFLRKRWREPWTSEYRAKLDRYASHFREQNVRFGVGLSPFELHLHEDSHARLEEKVKQLDVDVLGLFFDDMPVHDDLAQRQLEAIDVVRNATRAHIIFCPTFYTPDPILEKVFGKKPERYFEEIRRAPEGIDFAWTGPKVIPDEIPVAHLEETAKLLGRKPFLWDNLFANDGPRNCKFLKLRPPAGRTPEAFERTTGWAWNPMNQAALSRITLRASRLAVVEKQAPMRALERAIRESASAPLAELVLQCREAFLTEGFDKIDREAYRKKFAPYVTEPVAREIDAWLAGDYVVGSECLTD
jgi:hyaluronoglucosaminidase